MTSYINQSVYLFNDKNKVYPLNSNKNITSNNSQYFLNTFSTLNTVNLSVGSNIFTKIYK